MACANVLQTSSLYPDARTSSIATAALFYGACSNEEIQTTNAWAMVDLGNLSTCNPNSVASTTDLAGRVTVFPNPAADMITIQSFGITPETIQVYNMEGQLLKEISGNSQMNVNMDVADMESGMYFFRIIRKGQNVNVKVVIQ
jgi:Secretion system C-terminal sorting domain